jgi:hypothetical protein
MHTAIAAAGTPEEVYHRVFEGLEEVGRTVLGCGGIAAIFCEGVRREGDRMAPRL